MRVGDESQYGQYPEDEANGVQDCRILKASGKIHFIMPSVVSWYVIWSLAWLQERVLLGQYCFLHYITASRLYLPKNRFGTNRVHRKGSAELSSRLISVVTLSILVIILSTTILK